MEVHYFALDQQQAEKILEKCLPAGWTYLPFDPKQIPSALFLFSPLWCNEHFVNADSCWKTYLARHFPKAKLITLGFQPVKQLNYIDLLQPPENLCIFLEQAATCGEKWLPVPNEGLNMNRKLRRFFDGHGKESVQEAFNLLLMCFRIVENKVQQSLPYEKIYSEIILASGIIAHWQKLMNRWQAYYGFFPCLPFGPTFQQVNRLLTEIEPFFEQDCKQYESLVKLQLIKKIETINQLLKEAETYVH